MSNEALFVRVDLVFLQPQLAGMCIDIFGDNEGAMAIVNTPRSASRSKHIDVKFRFIQGLARAGEMRRSACRTEVLWRKTFVMYRIALTSLNCGFIFGVIFFAGYLDQQGGC